MTIPSHDMGRQILAAEREGLPLKIAVMLGNHPGVALFAATPIGYDESEYAYASAMMGAPIRLTNSGNGIDILADSEIVIERSEEHTSELQSLMRISYAVFCLTKQRHSTKNTNKDTTNQHLQ